MFRAAAHNPEILKCCLQTSLACASQTQRKFLVKLTKVMGLPAVSLLPGGALQKPKSYPEATPEAYDSALAQVSHTYA